MDTELWIRGIVLGFSIAAPVGPVGLLCIRRTLAEGRLAGLVSGLGAATADACYGLLAGVGVSWLANALVGQQFWLRLLGGGFLVYLGVQTFLARPAAQAAAAQGRGLLGAYFSTLAITFSNPATILSFAAIFAGIGAVGASTWSGAWLALGVFCGSAAWWLLLSGLVGLVRERLGARELVWVNRVSGVLIAALGLWAVGMALMG